MADYEARSQTTLTTAWAEFEGARWNGVVGDYDEPRATYVDDDLIVAVTNLPRAVFVTCFHEHFDRPHGVEPGPGASIGQRRLRYRRSLDADERGGVIRHLRRLRGV